MSTDEALIEAVKSLSPEQQASVLQFIDYLTGRKGTSPFLKAADRFIADHPELLCNLAK